MSGEGCRLTAKSGKPKVTHSRMHGIVEAVESFSVMAPRLSGPGMGSMIITRLTANGQRVQKGDLLVEFDRQAQEQNIIDREADFRDFMEQIEKLRASHDQAQAADNTELKAAENAVRSATLEIRKNEVVSQIDAEKNQQSLEEAKATLAQLRETHQLKRRARQAELRSLEIQRDFMQKSMQFAKDNIEKMSIRSPIDGIVVLSTTQKGGQSMEVQEGDDVRPGFPFMQVVNPSSMQVRVRVNQVDLNQINPGTTARVTLDAYPELTMPAKATTVAPIGAGSGMSNSVRTFLMLFSIAGADPRLMPDLSAAVDVELDRIPGAVSVPRDALIWRDGKSYVRVKNGSSTDQRAVTVRAYSDTEAALADGLPEKTVVIRNPQ
jgi:HlyD family secretion protein